MINPRKANLFFTAPSDHITSFPRPYCISVPISTTLRAWTSILNDTEALSRDRQMYSEALITRVYDPLKGLATKKDEARKKVSLLKCDVHGYVQLKK